MINRFSINQPNINNNNYSNIFHVNPYRVKRTYNTMLEQSKLEPNDIMYSSKRLKTNDGKPCESLIKPSKPKIPEKLLREIQRYKLHTYAYSMKLTPCTCQD